MKFQVSQTVSEFVSLLLVSIFAQSCAHSAVLAARGVAGEAKARSSTMPGQVKSEPTIYVYESGPNGFNTQNFFYDNGEEVVAIDTQFTPELAQKSIDFLRTKTSHPLTYAVVTHPNPDKFNGMSTFQKAGAKVMMSDRTQAALPGVQAYKQNYFVQVAKMFTDASYPKLGHPDVIFHDRSQITLQNGERIELTELVNPGVSSNQTVAYIPLKQALMVGDLVHSGVHAWLEGGIVDGKPTPTLSGWIADLHELRAGFPLARQTIVYGGRGDAGWLEDVTREQEAYLQQAETLVLQYLSELPAGGSADYAILQKRFEMAFSTRGLSYLIGYGVYGLVGAQQNAH